MDFRALRRTFALKRKPRVWSEPLQNRRACHPAAEKERIKKEPLRSVRNFVFRNYFVSEELNPLRNRLRRWYRHDLIGRASFFNTKGIPRAIWIPNKRAMRHEQREGRSLKWPYRWIVKAGRRYSFLLRKETKIKWRNIASVHEQARAVISYSIKSDISSALEVCSTSLHFEFTFLA